MSKRPLEGIRILDLSRLLPGPLATMFMADMGAEVIKVENPSQPDYVRNFPPVYEAEGKEFSANYLAFNRSKKSLTLDYTQPEGKEIFWKLVQTADVVVEQFRPGYLDKLGIGYNEAQKVNQKIIYVSITGYGQTGSYSHLAGHDLNYLSYSGILGLIGEAGKAPSLPAVQLADIAGGSYMAMIGTLAALQARTHTHKGQHVDISMTEGVMPLLIVPFTHYQATKQAQKRGETPLSGAFPNYNVYMCKDGKYISLATLEPKFWIKFCNIVQKPEFLGFAMPQEPEEMQKNKATLQTFFLTQERNYWLKLSQEHDLLISPVYEIDEIEQDKHLQERNMFIKMQHPQIGDVLSLAFPIKFSESPTFPQNIAPELGADTEKILQEIGFSTTEIEKFKSQNIV